MMLVYITNLNINRLIAEIDIKEIDYKTAIPYQKKVNFLNKIESNGILLYGEYLRCLNPNQKNILDKYVRVEKKKDSYLFVYEGNKPKFHKSNDCKFLHSDYKNYKIPDSIKKDNNLVVRYRQLFKSNIDLLNTNLELFKHNMGDLYYEDAIMPLKGGNNSGSCEIYNLNLAQTEDAINDKLRRYYILRKDSRLAKYEWYFSKKHLFNDYAEKRIQLDLNDRDFIENFFTNIKDPVKKLLLSRQRMLFNPDLSFQDSILLELGFSQCSKCF